MAVFKAIDQRCFVIDLRINGERELSKRVKQFFQPARLDAQRNRNQSTLAAQKRGTLMYNTRPDAHTSSSIRRGPGPKQQKTLGQRLQGQKRFEQTDSPLALFYVVAISWTRIEP